MSLTRAYVFCTNSVPFGAEWRQNARDLYDLDVMNLTALAVAATLMNIIDFQGRALDLTSDAANDFTPIQGFQSVDVSAQQVRVDFQIFRHIFITDPS